MKTIFFVLAHGAGAPSSHPWMRRWADKLRIIGPVFAFDYPYMKEHRKRPDPLPKLIAAHREALAEARKKFDGEPVLIGKSMGGRVGCHVALEEKLAAVVCLGYPLCGAGDSSKMRDEVLRKIFTPILFVQGTRDSLCPLDLLESVRKRMTAPNDLYIVEEGDHSLMVTKTHLKRSNEMQEKVEDRILAKIRGFIEGA
ncbi:MAG: alpha/beta fold hydrolase [Verrucomicrobia bacterium]|nr:alpha/beta fold hydrolase [Verrucomicrobiota bacterium]